MTTVSCQARKKRLAEDYRQFESLLAERALDRTEIIERLRLSPFFMSPLSSFSCPLLLNMKVASCFYVSQQARDKIFLDYRVPAPGNGIIEKAMNSQRLERLILMAVAQVTPDEWLSCAIGDLRNRLRPIDESAANASITSITDATLFLVQEGMLLLGKREDGGKRQFFDWQRQHDQGYLSNFFGRGNFDVKLTHNGRRSLDESQQGHAANEESDDRKFARLAIAEARRSIPENDGRPHPLVGAVVVKDGKVLASAHRGEAQGNHAEYIALEKRLSDAVVAGATVYTTLEPCTTRNHPKIPCAERLVERKIRRVVMGMLDPDPRITGKGQRRLRHANIITDFFPHDLMTEVEELNREFTRHIEATTTRPQSENRPKLSIDVVKAGPATITHDGYGSYMEYPHGFQAVVVSFKNHLSRNPGQQTQSFWKVTANLTFEGADGTIHIDYGNWLREYTRFADFAPGETHDLVIAKRSREDGPLVGLFNQKTMDPRKQRFRANRPIYGPEERLLPKPPCDVTVTLASDGMTLFSDVYVLNWTHAGGMEFRRKH